MEKKIDRPKWVDRLVAFLDEKMPGSNDAERARAVGASTQTYSNWVTGKTKGMPGDLASNLIAKWPGFDANYLYREDWPAELQKKPASQDGKRAESPLLNTADPSVGPADMPNATVFKSYSFGIGEDEKLFLDFVVSGPNARTFFDIMRERKSEG